MAEQPKEWWRQGFGYKEQAGTFINGKEVGYGMITDQHTGYTYFKDGDLHTVALKTSLEVCGRYTQEKEPAKVIYARQGDIVFEAPNGQITLKARNVRILGEDGEGEVTIQAGKTVEIDGPTARVKGTNVDITASSSASVIGSYVDAAAGVQQSSASLTDIFQGSFIGQILNSLGNLKKFLKLAAN